MRQDSFPYFFVTPTIETAMSIFPVVVLWRKIAPGSSYTKNPEHCIDKQPVILGLSSPASLSPKKERLQYTPYMLRNIMPMNWRMHNSSVQRCYRNSTKYQFMTTASRQMLRLDIKRLGKIDSVGHRKAGTRQVYRRRLDWEYLHVCVDDVSWMVCSDLPG